jgi:DNA-binding beta-propeller fold protein YncE
MKHRTAGLLSAMALIVVGGLSVSASLQQAAMPTNPSLQQTGGEDETGPYDVVANWPTSWAQTGYVAGSQPGVFAESPNRIFVAARGELKLPPTLPPAFNGAWASLGQGFATTPRPELRNTIVVLDGSGRQIEADVWQQWDSLFKGGPQNAGGPHKIRISPYDPERHIWVVDEIRHVIYKFSHDGKRLVKTLGETDKPGDDQRHFGQPQDVAFLPDGSMFVADGLVNSRIVKFDKDENYVTQWGSKGNGAGQFDRLHGIDADRNGRIYAVDRGNGRVQVFDQSGKHLATWASLRFPNHVLASPDGVWVADGTNERLLKFSADGKLVTYWGAYGTYPGAFQQLHQFSVDYEGNVYIADPLVGRVQKFTPKAGADKTRLIPASLGLPRR